MNNRKLIFLFVISFIVPLLLALAVLKLDWLPGKTVNNGTFLIPEVKLSEWAKINPKPWSIALLADENCSDICVQRRDDVRNLYIALGKNQNKVDLVLLGEQSAAVQGFKNYQPVSEKLQQDVLYLIDHMGLVVFYYPLVEDQKSNQLIQKGLIKDLKKLLNYARSS
ncbi:MAG TPA: transmembrane cytochrome oxidase associated protein [Psychromonas sp.]